jgi:hypothetical protein
MKSVLEDSIVETGDVFVRNQYSSGNGNNSGNCGWLPGCLRNADKRIEGVAKTNEYFRDGNGNKYAFTAGD